MDGPESERNHAESFGDGGLTMDGIQHLVESECTRTMERILSDFCIPV